LDTIFIEHLEIETVIGVFNWERNIRQTVIIDLEMDYDISRAGLTDAISDTLDYKAVCKHIIHHVESSSFELIEALSESVAEILITKFKLSRIKLRLSKPGALRGAKNVGVIIERRNVA
jgi:7,8-dihydroneopterin aldolase/epimerase/oxygenase